MIGRLFLVVATEIVRGVNKLWILFTFVAIFLNWYFARVESVGTNEPHPAAAQFRNPTQSLRNRFR